MRLPAWRTIATASGSPARTSATTPGTSATSRPLARRAVTSAAPLATASRQSRLPHRHTTPPPSATGLCPISPAAPRTPRCSTPPAMIPAPMPVDTLTCRRSETLGRTLCSARVSAFTSLSTTHGKAPGKPSAIGTPAPAGQQRRLHHGACRDVDRPREADAEAADGLVNLLAQRGRAASATVVSTALRSEARGVEVQTGLGQHRAREVADAQLGATRPDGGGQHHATRPVDAQPARRASSGRRGRGVLDDEAALGQLAHARGHRGAGQVRRPTDLGPCVHHAVVEEGEHVTGGDPGAVPPHCRPPFRLVRYATTLT